MKVLITGGTGFIGSHLIERLLERKFKIYALVRNPQNLKWLAGQPVTLLPGDINNLPSFPVDFDYIFHLAGLTKSHNPSEFYRINYQGTLQLLETVAQQKKAPQKFIFLSSLAVSGPSSSLAGVTEEEPPRPLTPYGRSKLLGEEACLRFQDIFPLAILRVSAVYGPRDKDFLPFFKIVKKGLLPLVRPGRRYLSICYVADLIRALELCLDKNFRSGEIFHVAHPQPISWDELGREAARILQRRVIPIFIPLGVLLGAALFNYFKDRFSHTPSPLNLQKYRELKQKNWVADTKKIHRLLDFRAEYDLSRGLRETLTWYQQHNWL